MEGLLFGLAALAAVVILAALGVDSRPEFDDPRAPTPGLTV